MIIKHKNTIEKWNESSTIKYMKVSIGEFQIHNNRNIVKFRFNMPKLLEILSDSKYIYTIKPLENIIVNKANSNNQNNNHIFSKKIKSI